MRDFLLLLKTELKMFQNSLKKSTGKKNQPRQKILSYAIMAVIFYFICIGARELFEAFMGMFSSMPEVLDAIIFNMLSAVSLGMYLLMFMTGFSGIYSVLFESGDLSFLMSTPLQPKAIFTAKLTKGIWSNFMTVMPFILAVWIGFGLASNAQLPSYLVSIFTMFIQVTAFTSFMAIIVMLISRATGSSRLRDIMRTAFLALVVVLLIGFQFANSALSRQGSDALYQLGNTFSNTNIFSNMNFLPHMLGVKANLAAMGGYSLSYVNTLLPLLAICLIVVIVCIGVANKMFLAGWTMSKEVDQSKKKKGADKISAKTASKFYLFKNHIWDFFYKDFLIWKRQPFLWYGIAVSLVGTFFLLYNFTNIGSLEDIMDIFKNVVLAFIIMMASFASGSLSIFSVSIDGESLWLFKTAPINFKSYYFAKLFLGMVPAVLVAILGIIGWREFTDFGAFPYWVALPVALLSLSAIQSVQLFSDIAKPNFDLNLSGMGANRRMNDPFKSLVLVVSGMIGSFLLVGLFALPSYGIYLSFFESIDVTLLKIIGAIAFVIVIAVLDIVFYNASLKRLKEIFTNR